MEEITFLSSSLSFLFLLLVACVTFLVSKKINFPYTVLLVIVGILLVPLSNIGILGFINDFKLTPDILFFVFLPILLFEASYKIDYRKIVNDWRAIGGLAIFGILISSLFIGGTLYLLLPFVGIDVPFLVTLLFGVIISATDPVAVLAIFQSIGAPRRLALLFEGESLFNDGTAVALFLVVLGIILSGGDFTQVTLLEGFGSFVSMMLGGALLGGIFGIVFAKGVGFVKNNEGVEIVLTMILAHMTFILAESITHYFQHVAHIKYLGISGVVSTVVAGVVMGNYGRYKVTPKVEKHVEEFWELLAFISNSIVFILIGLILSDISAGNLYFLLIPVLLAVVTVIIARCFSIYIPIGILNACKWGEKIPMSWQHILSWGSLRGALALMMVLLIPGEGDEKYQQMLDFQTAVGWNYDFGIKEFLLLLVIGCIIFTLVIKATTIPLLMRKTKVSDLHDFEKLEFHEGNILILLKVLAKVDKMRQEGELIKKEYKYLHEKYSSRLKKASDKLEHFLKDHDHDGHILSKRAINLHSLGAEKKYLKELFLGNEIGEKNFRFILRKIEQQILRLSTGKQQLRKFIKGKNDYNIFQKIALWGYKEKNSPADIFIRNRARMIITKKVIIELEALAAYDIGFKQSIFKETIEFYAKLREVAKKKVDTIVSEHGKTASLLDIKLAEKSIFALEDAMVEDMHHKGIISDKLYMKFKEEVEAEFYSDVKEDLETFCTGDK